MNSEPFPARPDLSRRSVLGLAGLGLAMQACRASAARSLFTGGATAAWHPLNLAAARYLTLPASVNGTALTAVIDSGATRSVIKDRIALDLGLPYLGATLAGTFTRDVPGSLYRVGELMLDGAAFRHIDVASFEMSQVEILAGSVPLVIGQDLLRQVAFEAQFTQDRIRLLDRGAAHAPVGHVRLALQGSGKGFPALPARIEVHGVEHAILDLGSSVPVSLSRDYAAQVGLLKDRPVSTTMTLGVEGPSVSQIFLARNARVGPFVMNQVPVCVIEDWELAQPINLGWPVLAAFDAVFDLGGDALWLKGDPARIAAPFPRDRSGLGGQRRADDILIRHVAMNSPAWQAGLREGDAIVAIDGRMVDAVYPPRGDRMGQKHPGTQFRLTLADRRNVTLTLADYF